MLTKGSRALDTRLVPSTLQDFLEYTVAHGSKKQTTALLSTGSKFMSDFINDFLRADKN